MSWSGPEDLFLSTSLASYLDICALASETNYADLSWTLGAIPGFSHLPVQISTPTPFPARFDLGSPPTSVLPPPARVSCEKLLVSLRDGRKLLGILRSFDQFANAVLEGACERVIVGDLYCDISLGLYVIRGENVVLIGELAQTRLWCAWELVRRAHARLRCACTRLGHIARLSQAEARRAAPDASDAPWRAP
ncbi:hypothetical protein KSP40_PGU010820 [Platanthera guangdongensis]|uniref:U6 snRNA-associated Sm-like protein LSm1 n=1 Tax=Platanthera guangdongensis TaxID=2320717 RepID=A0ABR2LHM9_9ASPA